MPSPGPRPARLESGGWGIEVAPPVAHTVDRPPDGPGSVHRGLVGIALLHFEYYAPGGCEAGLCHRSQVAAGRHHRSYPVKSGHPDICGLGQGLTPFAFSLPTAGHPG